MGKDIKPLWRKMNKEIRGVERVGSKYDKGTKNGTRKSMSSSGNDKDYRPLYKFLLKHVGENFDDVCSQIYDRIDDRERIWDIVDKQLSGDVYGRSDVCRVEESSYYSVLIIDENNNLQLKNPNLRIEHLFPSCDCCTHTFNGIPYINKYKN